MAQLTAYIENSKIGFRLDKEKRFVILFFTSLLISFSPSKALGQFVAVFFLLGMIFFVQVKPQHNLLRYILVASFYGLLSTIYYFLVPEFSFLNYFVFFVTFSSILILFYDFGAFLNPSLLRKLSKGILVIIFFEALYGIAQGLFSAITTRSLDIGNGDVVRGTIEPGFRAAGLGGNVMFAILISALLIFVLAASGLRFSLFRMIVYGTVLLSWVIASVLHTILFFGCAILLAVIVVKVPKHGRAIIRRLSKFRVYLLAILVLLAVLLPIFLPNNLETVPRFLSFTFDIQENAYSEKARSTFFALFRLPEEAPLQPLIGLGPGQYSSRASLIMSGQYLQGTSLPLPHYASALTEKYILALWNSVKQRPGMGSSYFPFYSWLSLYTEMGIIGILAALLILVNLTLNIRRWNSVEFPGLSIAMLTLLFYIAFLGIQDNYWEFTQAIFPAFLSLSIGYNYLRSEKRIRAQRPLVEDAKPMPLQVNESS